MNFKFHNTKNVKEFEYDTLTGDLVLTFVNDRKYEYKEVQSQDVAKLMIEKDSFPKQLSKKYKYKEI